jgi:rieske iron-sulfur protein
MLLTTGAGLGLGLTPAPAGAQSDAARLRPQEGDLLVPADGSSATPLTATSIPEGGGPLMALPFDPVAQLVRNGSRLNKVLLLRLDPSGFNDQTAQRAAAGVIAYSAVCPHTGCEVVNWHAEKQFLECPCHNSFYDPNAGAKVVSGPSPRSLAALPLRIADDKLVVAHPFIGRLGMQQA